MHFIPYTSKDFYLEQPGSIDKEIDAQMYFAYRFIKVWIYHYDRTLYKLLLK